MREFELIIDEALRIGLSPEYTVPFNSQLLWECLGFRLAKGGLEPFTEGTNPLPSTLDMYYSWPFPQFIVGEKYNFLIIRDTVNLEDAIYSIADDMTLDSYVFSVDQLTFGQGTLMEVADFGEYAVMVNGVARVYWNVLGAWNASVATATMPLMTTICNFKGKAVGGGVQSAWHDCDETFYVWSKIGELDFTPDNKNTAGYRRCPYGGEVLHTRRLGDSVIGYSSKGVTQLIPVVEPAPTFKFVELSDVGIVNQGAEDGNLVRRIYVGTDLIIREITKEGVKELGFQYWMEQLADEDIIVSFDKSTGDFYIGNSTTTYLLSPYGMTEIPQHPSAVWRVGSNLYMLPDAVDSYYPLITTEVFDFGYKGLKTLSVMETDAIPAINVKAAVDYIFDTSKFGNTTFVPVNNLGVATIPAAGNSFRFKLRFDTLCEGFRVSYIIVRYKMTDLRSIRGVYAPPPRGQR